MACRARWYCRYARRFGCRDDYVRDLYTYDVLVLLLRPTLMEGWTTREGLSSNERAVKVAKRSGLLQRGLQLSWKPSDIADAWLAWGFQANFMYKPVL